MFNYAYNNIVNNYVNFNGRSSRAAYNYQVLFNILVLFLAGFIVGLVYFLIYGEQPSQSTTDQIINYINVIYSLPLLLPHLGLIVRRFHDLNMSGWMFFIFLVPLVNLGFLIYIMAARGTFGTNNYGEDPTDTPLGTIGINNPAPTTRTNVTPGSTKDILSK